MEIIYIYFFTIVPVGTASEILGEWADEEAGIESVQRILDSLDDIYAIQDPQVDPDVLQNILYDKNMHQLLQVSFFNFLLYFYYTINNFNNF